jgi:hypothetical protein
MMEENMSVKHSWVLNACICWMVLVAFSCLSLFPGNANAALVQSRLADGVVIAERSAQIETIRQTLEREVVAQRLADYGFTPAEVADKLPSLSDEQLHQLAGLSDTLGEGGVLGFVVAVLVIALLVIVILKVTDKQVIVK